MRWLLHGRFRIASAALLGGWALVNVLSAYAAANPWLTKLLWAPAERSGQLADVVDGEWVDTSTVLGHFAAPTIRTGTVVVVHGYGDDHNAAPVVTAATWLTRDGWGVLAIDLGYLHGRHRYSAGHREALDISHAISWLEANGHKVAAVWGFSAGAHAALIAASRDPRIPAVISDSAFVDGATQIRRIASQTWRLPQSAFPLVGAAMSAFSGDAPVDVRSSAWSGTPVLMVHGKADQVVPIDDAEVLCEHTSCELIKLPGVDHLEAHDRASDEYRHKALSFLTSAPSTSDARDPS